MDSTSGSMTDGRRGRPYRMRMCILIPRRHGDVAGGIRWVPALRAPRIDPNMALRCQ
jgi:hypothetical protein